MGRYWKGAALLVAQLVLIAADVVWYWALPSQRGYACVCLFVTLFMLAIWVGQAWNYSRYWKGSAWERSFIQQWLRS